MQKDIRAYMKAETCARKHFLLQDKLFKRLASFRSEWTDEMLLALSREIQSVEGVIYTCYMCICYIYMYVCIYIYLLFV